MKTEYPNIRAVAFDYGGVLAYFIDKESIKAMADLVGVDYTPFHTNMWKFRQELDSGEYDNTQYWSRVLAGCNAEVPRASLVETLVEMDLKGFSKMNTNMLAWVETLKKQGFITLIISNMAEPTYQSLVAPQPCMQYFDAAIISCIIGINKPDQRIFKHAIEHVRLDAAEILFLDDLPHNVTGAQEAGLHSLVFSNTDQLARDLALSYPNLPREGLLSFSEN